MVYNNYISNTGIEVKSPIRINVCHPLDARSLVDTVEDLYNYNTWVVEDDDHNLHTYLYDGMIVSTKIMDEHNRPQVFVFHGPIGEPTDDHEHWLTPDNWQRFGYVLDEKPNDIAVTVVYGWVFVNNEYIGPDFLEVTPEMTAEVFTYDQNGRVPGSVGYIPTQATPYNAVKVIYKNGDEDAVLYIPTDAVDHNIYIENKGSKQLISDITKSGELILKGVGSVALENAGDNTINIGLVWESVNNKYKNMLK